MECYSCKQRLDASEETIIFPFLSVLWAFTLFGCLGESKSFHTLTYLVLSSSNISQIKQH